MLIKWLKPLMNLCKWERVVHIKQFCQFHLLSRHVTLCKTKTYSHTNLFPINPGQMHNHVNRLLYVCRMYNNTIPQLIRKQTTRNIITMLLTVERFQESVTNSDYQNAIEWDEFHGNVLFKWKQKNFTQAEMRLPKNTAFWWTVK